MNTKHTTTYFKAVRPDGSSFRDQSFRWLPEGWRSGDPIPEGWTVEHPDYSPTGTARRYLSVSTVATDCIGMRWPLVLLEVEAVGETRSPEPGSMPSKRAGAAFRVVRELSATDALGPQGEHVAALIERCQWLTASDVQRLASVWAGVSADALNLALNDAGDAAWRTARSAAADVAADAVWAVAGRAVWVADGSSVWATRYAAWSAALGLSVRDLISPGIYYTLTRAWRATIGPIHPDDDLED